MEGKVEIQMKGRKEEKKKGGSEGGKTDCILSRRTCVLQISNVTRCWESSRKIKVICGNCVWYRE